MKRLAVILGILILVSFLIIPASAEYAAGNISAPDGWYSTNYLWGSGAPQGAGSSMTMVITNVELTGNAKSLIHFDYATAPAIFAGQGGNTNQTGYTRFNWTSGGVVVATGQKGFQRMYDSGWPVPSEVGGFQYWQFDTWNTTGLSGTITVAENTFGPSYQWITGQPNFLIDHAATNGTLSGSPSGYPHIQIYFNGYIVGEAEGTWTFNKEVPFRNSYNATKPSGVGITGWVMKNEIGGSFKYNSRAYITTGTSPYTPLTSEQAVSGNDFYFNVPADTIKICLKNSNGDWFNSSRIFNVTTTPTPTQTPLILGDYSVSVDHQYINQTGQTVATITSLLDPPLDGLSTIDYYATNQATGAVYHFMEVGSTVHQTFYEKIGGTWQGYDTADVDYNNNKAGIPVPITLKWDCPAGTYDLNVHLVTPGGQWSDIKTTVHVGTGSENLIETKIQAMDGVNGGLLQMVNMQIYNHNTGTWYNISPNSGQGTILTPANTILSVYVQKAGFTDGELIRVTAQNQYTYVVNLYRGVTPATGFVNEFFSVQETGGGYIGGAQIVITKSSDGSSKYGTSSQNGGSLVFNLTNSTLYTWTVTKTGYQTRSGSFTTPASGSQITEVFMLRGSVITTVRTTAPIPTGSWTVNPSMTPANQGNLTGFWSPWINVFSQMGASSFEMPLLIAGLIIVICMAAGFGMAGVLGGEVFMGFGAIFCVALGLIPIWVVLAIIVLGFLFYGLKIGR